MRRSDWCWWFLVVVVISGAGPRMDAQRSLAEVLQMRGGVARASVMQEAVAPAESTEEALQELAAQAGVIFTGEVMAVRERGSYREVEFDVEEGVRGAISGERYVMREWMGMAAAGGLRYHTGQRSLVLLHAPSAAGFSSPVGGADGVIPLRGDAVTGEADLRWVEARVRRAERAADGLGIRSMRALPVAQVPAVQREMRAAAAQEVTETSLERPTVERTLVMGLLQAWERSRTGVQP